MSGGSTAGLLAGITVLDLTQFLAGPYATQILGDLGARVVKIEPLEGEMTRSLAPHFFKDLSAYFLSVNRNKQSLALDLKSERGREVFLRMVRKADIVLENFRPGVMDRLNLGYDVLREANRAIVMCSISGFGQSGPYRDRPAYDMIVQAMSGGMSMTGEEGGTAVRAGIPIGDLSAGMYSVIASLSGIAKAKATGEGAYIDVSMLDCQVSMLTYQAAYHLIAGEVPGLQGRAHRSFPTYRAFKCSDGVEIVVTANTERMWRGLCDAVGAPGLALDARFGTNDLRLLNKEALAPLLEDAFAQLTSAEVLKRLVHAEVPACPINTLDRSLSDPHVLQRDMVISLRDSDGSSIRVVGNPVKTPGIDSADFTFPPRLGEHTAQLLAELADVDGQELCALEELGVVGMQQAG